MSSILMLSVAKQKMVSNKILGYSSVMPLTKKVYFHIISAMSSNLEYLRNSEISSISLRSISPISDSYGIVNIQKEPFSIKLEMALCSVLPPYICDDFEARIRVATSRSSQSSNDGNNIKRTPRVNSGVLSIFLPSQI